MGKNKRIRAEFSEPAEVRLVPAKELVERLAYGVDPSVCAPTVEVWVPAKLIAKRDFEIFHNAYHIKIKKGDDITDVPALFHANLKTEGVL